MHFPTELMSLAMKVGKKDGKISDDDWEDILNKLKKALHPHLQYIANKPLGDVNLLNCSSGNTIKDEIESDNSNCDCGSIALRTPGLWFPAILFPKKGEKNTDRIYVWGITRDYNWALVIIDANLLYETKLPHPPRVIYNVEVEFMRPTFSCPSEICQDCGITYEEIYRQILKAVSDWANRRKELADEAEKFNLSLQFIDTILHF